MSKLTQLEKRLYCYVKRLNQTIADLEAKLAEKEKEVAKWKNKKVKYIVDNIICDRNQTAIAELEKVKAFIIKNNEPTKKMTAITRFINQQIKLLKGEK